MCGIIGVVSGIDFKVSFLLERLKRLEYRGYDSYGYSDSRKTVKSLGAIKAEGLSLTRIGIAHTRWSTHGGVTRANAHPHESCNGEVIIAHNGIIENYWELKTILERQGHKFRSETDSEVVAHYFEEKIKQGKGVKKAISDFLKEVSGTFAILMMIKGEDKIYAIKRDSPLVLGICEGKKAGAKQIQKHILASDIYAFSDITDKAVFFENDEFAVVEAGAYEFYDAKGSLIKKKVQSFEWNQEEGKKKDYKHFMIKEIEEEPLVVSRMLLSLDHEQKDQFKKLVSLVKKSRKIIFAACGTSYHASLLGAFYLHTTGIEAQTLIASEFKHYANVDKDTLVIAISQSGETMDVIDALKYAQEKKATIVSLVNVPYSTIQRMSALSLNILAGQEVAVASTKAFVNQSVLLLRLAQEFGYKVNLSNLGEKIKGIFSQKDDIKRIAKQVSSSRDAYVLGRGQTYPVAREIALKVKEITYMHAEGMMGGELKHGTIALIDKGTPVISLIGCNDEDMVSNTKEVEARGAEIITITNNASQCRGSAKNTVFIDTDNDGKFGILACVAGQLLAYYVAEALGREIDKPRNLAKSVTVK
ncbi:glutamine--fructose-6-phosphate transaminase (isomerizing) [Candidatus Woesearchaeota archaeon]|nr:glutamine--fructose-6-phosphate transaminase (isomerizing) [Candidatus Woesearchaeota archaeon]